MFRFTSPRERRLWTLVLALVIALAASAVFAGRLVRMLGEHDLLEVAFAAGFLTVIASVIGLSLHTRPRASDVWIAIGAIAVFAMIVVRLGIGPIERTHLFEYGLLAVVLHEALEERSKTRPVPSPAVLAMLLTIAVGWLDEGLQLALPDRVYDLRDVLFNALAAVGATGSKLIMRRIRRRGASHRRDTTPRRSLSSPSVYTHT